MKRFLTLLLVFVLIISAVACTKDKKEEKKESKIDFEIKANEVKDSKDSVTFKNHEGKEVTIKKGKKRVISLYNTNTILWHSAGGKLVGRISTKGGDKIMPKDLLEDKNVKIVGKSSSAKNLSVEKILGEKPDLILVGHGMSQRELQKPFSQAGVDSVVIAYESFDDYLKWFKVFSLLNNKPELYESVAKKTLKEVEEVISKVDHSKKPKVLALFGSSRMRVNTSNSNLGIIIKQLGGVNVVDNNKPKDETLRIEMNLESIVKADPDIIVVQTGSSVETAKKSVEKAYGSQESWKNLKAVKNNKLFYLPPELFLFRANERYGEAYKMMFEILYKK